MRFYLNPTTYSVEFQQMGYAVFNDILSTKNVETLRQAIQNIPEGDEIRRKRSVYGIRNLLEVCSAVRDLAKTASVRQFATPILGPNAFAVRAIFFDKVPDANWVLGWHQDNAISVMEKKETPGFVGWSNKAGVWQVQPPADVLANMVTVRVHLDDCGPDNGPLRVLPGSHRSGWQKDSIAEWKKKVQEVKCTVNSGGVVVMCPLTLHASSPAKAASHRRVVHIEFAVDDLPGGLQWKNQIS